MLFGLGCLLLAALSLSGCMTPEQAKTEADEQTYGIVARAREAAGQAADPDFTIEPGERLRENILLPRSDDETPGPLERLARDGEEVKVDLDSALAIAARNSRDFQAEKESLYATALSLTGSLHDFETQWFSTIDLDASSIGDGDQDSTQTFTENGSLGFTRLIERGGSMSLAIGETLQTMISKGPTTDLFTSFVNFTISLPLLRGAGREIAYENVIQAERDVIYSVRSYERFKRTFAVDITSSYLRLLQGLQTIENNKNDYARRQTTAAENRELGEAGRIARTDVERTNQAELRAENSVIVAQQNHEGALDRFKQDLGLPPDAKLSIDPSDLTRLNEQGAVAIDIDEKRALEVAFRNRLDLATDDARVADAKRRVVVAADALQAGLDFSASAGLDTPNMADGGFRLDLDGDGTYTLGMLLDLPLDRVAERNAYRSALISLESSRRAAERSEDGVKADVRAALRALYEARESYRIQKAALQVSETAVDAAKLLKDAGEGTTNDLLDAQNDLINAQNAVTQALISYYIARLELFRDMGILVVTPEGIDHEATQRLLEAE